MLGSLRRIFASPDVSTKPGGGEPSELSEVQALRADRDRLEALADAQERRAIAAQKALEAMRSRLDQVELELYVARSDHQRAAVMADELRRELASRET